MKHKLQIKNLALSLVLALAMVAGALPGVMQTGHAAMHYEVYIDNNSITNGTVIADKTETSGSEETVTLTVTPSDGYNLKKLSVIQPDVLDSVSDLVDLMGAAVFSLENEYSVKIDEGKFSVFHNEEIIASLDNSENLDNRYGAGGYYTVNNENSGFWRFYIIGGKLREIEFRKGNDNLTFHGIGAETISGTAIETTTVTEGTKYTFAAPRSNVYVTAEFEMLDPKTVLIDVGKGHESLFTSDVLNQIKTEFLLEDVTISGNIITLKGVDPQMTEGKMQYAIWSVIDGLTDLDGIDNGDYFLDVGYKPIDDYTTEKEYGEDVYGDERYETPISDGMTFYALWQKPYTKLEIDNGNPKCGMISWKSMPNVPDGLKLDPENSYWKDGEGEFAESFKGGNEYTFNGQIYVYNWSGDYWKYYFNPDNFTMTVKDAKDFEYNYDGHGWIKFSYKATADHDWDAGTVTKEPTETAEGVKTFKCKHFDTCGGTKTEAIPKLKPTPAPAKSTAKPVLVAKGISSGNTAARISWNNVKADRYVVYLARCNYRGKTFSYKKIKTVNAKTLKLTKKQLKKNTAYKFYVVAQKKSGGSYKNIAKSKVGHFFTGNVRGSYTNPKNMKLSKSAYNLKKGKSATIKASVSKARAGKKLATNHAAKLRFTSNNPKVATVNAKGKVTAKSKGTATIYVQTINGIWKTCRVTVK